jgi:WD40 repeat protein/serine/threonine protein kinase
VYDPPGGGPQRVGALDQPSIRKIGPYDLLEPLGRGGMGVVYRARHRDLDTVRAIKLLPPHLATDDSFVARFRREAMLSASLRHPNIVLIYDVGEQDDYHYFVMDLVEGRSLRDVIRADKPLAIDRIIRLLRPLAAALDFAHQRGVVHRDVKPTNVVVGDDDRVTLLDFGIARAIEGAQQLTRAGLIVGTPEYMAPEVVTGGVAESSADLYALGVVAFEMLTGHTPFHGTNTTAVAFAHVNTPPPSPRADRADLPEPMERVLLRQLAKDPTSRFPDAKSFVDALDAAATEPVDATQTLPESLTGATLVLDDAGARRNAPSAAPDAGPQARRQPPSEPPPAVPASGGRGTPAARPTPTPPPPFPLPPVDRPTVAVSSFGPPAVEDGRRARMNGSPPASAAPHPASSPPRKRLWLLVGVAVVLFVVGGGYGVMAWRGETRPAPAPVAQATRTQGTAAKPTVPTTAVATGAATGTGAAAPAPTVIAPAQQLQPTQTAAAAAPNAPGSAAAAPLDEARAAIAAGDFPRAIDVLTDAKSVTPAAPGLDDLLFQAFVGQGQADLQRGDPDASAGAFDEALKLRPNDAQAQTGQRQAAIAGLRRQAEASAGRDDDAAITALEGILALAPDDGDARSTLYPLLIARADRLFEDDGAQARAALQRATELDPNRPEARERLARFAIGPGTAERVQEVARWGKGTVDGLAYSADGTLLAVASSYGVYLYDVATRSERHFLETGVFVWDVALSPDGQEVAAALGDGSVYIWKTADGDAVRSLEGHEGAVRSVAYAPDGQFLVSGGADMTTRVWQRSDGAAIRTMRGHEGTVRGVAISPDGQRIAAASADRTARIWNAATGAPLQTLRGHEDEVTDIAFSPDGQTLGTASQDQTVRLWRAADGGLLRTLAGHTGWVLGVAFSADGQSLVSAAADNTARIWRTADGTPLRTLQGHAGWVVTAAVSGPPGQPGVVATGSRDGTIRFWNVGDGAPVAAIAGMSSLVRGVAISPDGATVAASLENGTIQLLRTSDGSLIRTLTGHGDAAYSVAFSPDGQMLVSGSDDRTVKLWRVADGQTIRTLSGHTDWVRVVRFGDAGQNVFSGSADKTVRVWRVADGAAVRTIDEHEWGVSSLAVSPEARVLATGTADAPIRLFRPAERIPPRVLGGHGDWVNGLAMSEDGLMLASASADKTVRLWRLPDGAPLRTLAGHTDAVASVAFVGGGNDGGDGQSVVSSGRDGTVRLWRTADGSLTRTLDGHTKDVNSVAVSADRQWIVSGSSDGTIRLWGVR